MLSARSDADNSFDRVRPIFLSLDGDCPMVGEDCHGNEERKKIRGMVE